MDIQLLFDISPYSLNKKGKEKFFNNYLHSLTQHHYKNCIYYKKMLDSFVFDPNELIIPPFITVGSKCDE